jgi:hypothetical protein
MKNQANHQAGLEKILTELARFPLKSAGCRCCESALSRRFSQFVSPGSFGGSSGIPPRSKGFGAGSINKRVVHSRRCRPGTRFRRGQRPETRKARGRSCRRWRAQYPNVRYYFAIASHGLIGIHLFLIFFRRDQESSRPSKSSLSRFSRMS